MDPGHKARKNPSDNADRHLGFQAVGPARRIMQLNVEGLLVAKFFAYEKKASRSVLLNLNWIASVRCR